MAVIGRATAEDASAIAGVYVDTWRAAYAGLLPDRVLLGMSAERQAAEWSWLIRNRSRTQPVVVAAELGQGVVGFANCGPARGSGRPAGGPYAADGGPPAADRLLGEVFTLYVRPEFQDRGIGRQLLVAAFAALRERGCRRALVWVLAENPARFFYERMGGSAIAHRRERLWGVELDETAYGWPDLDRTIGRIGSCSTT